MYYLNRSHLKFFMMTIISIVDFFIILRCKSNVIDSKIIKSISKKLNLIVKTSNLNDLNYLERFL